MKFPTLTGSYTRIASVAAVLAIILCGLWWRHDHPALPPYIQHNVLKVPSAIEYWRTDIARTGPEQAHADMVREAYTLSPSLRHILAHTFGEALYDAGGLPYIVYCGQGEFLFGCFHQFIGLSTAAHGIAVLDQLKSICDSSQKEKISCAHGIGHALLSTLGYTPSGMSASLSRCDSMYDTRADRGVCADGAFMEYNLREITALDEDSTIRPFAEESTYEPCLSIGAEFRNECMFELPLWWATYARSLAQAGSAEKIDWSQIGGYCRAIPSHKELIPVCYMSIGFPVAQFEKFSDEKITAACHEATTSSREYLLCISGAVRRFYENGLPFANECRSLGLTGADLDFCNNFVSLPRHKEFDLIAS